MASSSSDSEGTADELLGGTASTGSRTAAVARNGSSRQRRSLFHYPAVRLLALAAAAAIGFVSLRAVARELQGRRKGDDVGRGDAGDALSEEEFILMDVYKDWSSTSFTPPPLPTCRCQGWRGEADGYRWGASPEDAELCQRPWGGRYMPCERPHAGGWCNRGSMRCAQRKEPAPTPAPSAQANESEESPSPAEPASTVAGALATALNESLPCLCVFDVDRTLTARQYSNHGACPHSAGVMGAWDNAYGRGELTLSAASARGLSNSSCAKCYVGICSHGSAGNWKEKQTLVDRVLDTEPYKALAKEHPDAKKWSWGIRIPHQSPIAVGVPDRLKQWAVEGILNWYWSKNITIPRERVWFFDDRQDNADNFAGTGMHSRQISCASRDWGHRGQIGFCGIAQSEIERLPGNFNCHRPPTDADRAAVRVHHAAHEWYKQWESSRPSEAEAGGAAGTTIV